MKALRNSLRSWASELQLQGHGCAHGKKWTAPTLIFLSLVKEIAKGGVKNAIKGGVSRDLGGSNWTLESRSFVAVAPG